jgi:hypothetical protein
LSKSKRVRACKKAHFQRKVLTLKPVAAFVAMCCSGVAMAADAPDAPAPAARDVPVEEVVITSLRQSLVNSESIKRDASGVVDAITAEDIGKFPDTNLAEAVQRIPGVTIDRVNNEGSQVTVRGFGPEFNLVTLNGRSMPGNIIPGGPDATRSFDFANLSAYGISGITVYKTGRADMPAVVSARRSTSKLRVRSTTTACVPCSPPRRIVTARPKWGARSRRNSPDSSVTSSSTTAWVF